MLSVKFFIGLIIVALLVTALVLFSDRIFPQNTGTPANPPTSFEDDLEGNSIDETVQSTSVTPESAESLVISQEDGLTLLNTHCSKCHVTSKLLQLKKSRADWEMTLAQMETLGVRLTGEERSILLNNLLSAANP